MDRTD
jgi:protein BCP1